MKAYAVQSSIIQNTSPLSPTATRHRAPRLQDAPHTADRARLAGLPVVDRRGRSPVHVVADDDQIKAAAQGVAAIAADGDG